MFNLLLKIFKDNFVNKSNNEDKLIELLSLLNINPLDYDHYKFNDPLVKLDVHDEVSGVIRKSSSFQIDNNGIEILIQRLDYIEKSTLIITYESKDSERLMKNVVDKFARYFGNDFINRSVYTINDYNHIYFDDSSKRDKSYLIRLWNLGIATVQIMDFQQKGAIVHSTIKHT